jgi:hypothetical protein
LTKEKQKWFSGGGGLLSTAPDYARFCQMLLNGGEHNGIYLLSPKTIGVMTSDQLPPGIPRLGLEDLAPTPKWDKGSGSGSLSEPMRVITPTLRLCRRLLLGRRLWHLFLGRSAIEDVRRDDGSDAFPAIRLLSALFSRADLWSLAPLSCKTLEFQGIMPIAI